MMTIMVLMVLPLDTPAIWSLPSALNEKGLVADNPAGLLFSSDIVFYGEGGWREGLVAGPLGVGFALSGRRAVWLEIGESYAYFSDTSYIIRDDSVDVDTVSRRSSLRLRNLRLLYGQRGPSFSWAAEAAACLGAFSDEFSSSTGTIFPENITVLASPYAFGGGVGFSAEIPGFSLGGHARAWAAFMAGGRSFDGDSGNSFVLRETLIPDSVEGSVPWDMGLVATHVSTGLGLEALYRSGPGILLSEHGDFGPLRLRAGGGWMGGAVFLGDISLRPGRWGLGLRGGYWRAPRISGFLFYAVE